MATKIVEEGGRVLRAVLLGRLLSPEHFGQFAIATLVLVFFESVTETGFNVALVRHPRDVRPYLDTALVVSVARAIILSLAIFAVAPIVASWFKAPDAVWVIRAAALQTVLRSLNNPGTVYLTRNLRFKKIFYWKLAECGVGLLAALIFGRVLKNAWALVFASWAAEAGRTLASYVVHSYRPHPVMRWDKALELARFGRWILGANLQAYLGAHCDTVIVGAVLGSASLGLYQMGARIAALPRALVTDTLCRIGFPLFSKYQSTRRRVRGEYFRIVKLNLLVVGLCTCIVFGFARTLVVWSIGLQWVQVVPVLRTLIWAEFLRSLAVVACHLFNALGQPSWSFFVNSTRLVTVAALVCPLSQHVGLLGSSIGALCGTGAVVPVWVVGVNRLLGLRIGARLRRSVFEVAKWNRNTVRGESPDGGIR